MIRDYYERLSAAERAGRPLRLVEEARSAYHPGRPLLEQILHLADRGQVQGVIVVHPNRVSRNHADSGAFVQRLVDGRIGSLDTTAGKRYTGADSNDIFMLTLEGAMSWKDSRDKGDRILQAMRLRTAEGRHMGPPPVGYRCACRPDGSKALEVVPEVAPLVLRLFTLAATGTYSVQALVREARAIGLTFRTGNPPAKGAMHRILRDPLYKGYVRFDSIVAKGRHEPIVPEAVWEQAQRALAGRCTNAARPKDPGLRDLFFFGNLLTCPRCGRRLYPYRVKRRYVYYECKNPDAGCGVLVPQAALVEQFVPLLDSVRPGPADLATLRERLLAEHRRQSGQETSRQSALKGEYERVTREIGELFAQRKDAEAMGVLAEVDARLAGLRQRRDELHGHLTAAQDQGEEWVERVIRTFDVFELLREAIFYASARPREMLLRGIASNYSVKGKTLVWEPRAPFRQVGESGGRPSWCTGLYDVRTEIAETCEMLETAYSALKHAKLLAA